MLIVNLTSVKQSEAGRPGDEANCHVHKCSWLGSIFDKKHKMWDQLTTFWSLDRAEKHYSLKEQPLNMPLGSQNPYAKRAYSNGNLEQWQVSGGQKPQHCMALK